MICERCDKPFTPARRRRGARFCSRRCANTSSARRGPESRFWRGGRDIGFNTAMGRWVVYCRDGEVMLYSRAVMAGHLGRLLVPGEIVHHGNEDKTDDRIENLKLTDRAGHIRMHMAELVAARS